MRLKLLMFLIAGAWSVVAAPPLLAVTESGDIHVRGTVPAPPPTTAPTIDSPAPDTTFDTKNITVKGTCTPDLIVKIYSNNIFVGSTICQADGTYSLKIDLFLERNNLVARQFDALNQSSPPSDTVSVYYIPARQKPHLPDDRPGHATPPPTVAHFQLIIDYDYTVQGVFVGQPFHLPVAFRGGMGPYVVTIDWGDGSNNRFNRATTDTFDVSYTYSQPGRYIVTIQVTDSSGQTAYLQFVTIVHGEADSPGTITLFGHEINQDIGTIVGFGFVILCVLAFLAGLGFRKRTKIDNKP